ncbi:trypsin-like peptidase domain-containing protein [Streptomyces sp. G1]|uniref:nSTAND1 domain-containing NTPase n=1 Tax=Streptomyces sp. G1 TaxID=361572 RepID=UPI00202F9329|nr:trypsin-like peptidase domain-containing protein [Streptomyces sp. G1]MCM1973714.1 trypsin-like peptidase domain-containing protein [Streptomyces sp. G1]
MADTAKGAEDGTPSDLPAAVAQVLGPDGEVAGAGFLVAEDVLVTCAHVVRAAGAGAGELVRVVFPHMAGADGLEGRVEEWRAPEAEDVAFIRLREPPPSARVLSLGSAEGCGGHRVRSFGFPAQARQDGHLGFGRVGGLLPASQNTNALLQLTEANDLTTGFSGGPVLDEMTGLVVGMVTEITAPDRFGRGQNIAYATPTEVLREVRPELAAQDVCPYRGLESFTTEHAPWFRGRGEAVRQVLANLASGRRMTLLLGPSGSGKSSLVQAGVLQALSEGQVPGSDRWLPVLARPRQDLPTEIERAGLPGASRDGISAAVTGKLLSEPEHQRVLLVIDQFEELLVQGTDGRPGDFMAVIDDITTAAGEHGPLSVILIMRDDFYHQLAALAPQLLAAATPGLLNIPGVLSADDLHDIIVERARLVGLRFQPGLPEQIISDVLASSPDGTAPGQAPVTVLPLLELTLDQLWRRRKDGFLTHEAYRRIGGVTGSLTTWCDSALGQLSPGQQEIARHVLTSLVRPADRSRRTPPVRAQVPLNELRDLAVGPERSSSGSPDGSPGSSPDSPQDDDVDAVIATLARHRIITTQRLRDPQHPDAPPGEPVAELIHDALIRDWGALREWVRLDHEFLEWLDRTRVRQARWAEQRDPGDLLAGTALAEGVDWSRSGQWGLPDDIATFLSASRQRQEAAAQRRKRLITMLATLLVLALLAGAGALWQWRTAAAQRQAAVSRQLATQSDTISKTNPELASLLAVQAYRTSDTAEALQSLRTSSSLPLQRRLSGHDQTVDAVAFSPDGKTLATGSFDGTARLWDVASGKTRHTLKGHTDQVWTTAFSPDGSLVATGGRDAQVQLWKADTGELFSTLTGHESGVTSVAFSPDGKTLAAAGYKTVQLWDLEARKAGSVLSGHTNLVTSVAFSPDGKTLATGSGDSTARLWDADTGKTRRILAQHIAPVNAVAFNPDGKSLATAFNDGVVVVSDVETGTPGPEIVTVTESVAFSPDGRTLATGGSGWQGDYSVTLWNPTTAAPISSLTGHSDQVLRTAFSPDGRTLASVGRDHTVRLWDVNPKLIGTALTGHTDLVSAVAFSRDGKTVATGSADKTARLWTVATGTSRQPLRGHSDQVSAVAFSPDGKTLATGSGDQTARLWDTDMGKTRMTLLGHTQEVYGVAFHPHGKVLATASSDHTARLWDIGSGKASFTLTGHTLPVAGVAFSPDGHTLATASLDFTARLWAVDLPQPSAAMEKICRAVNRDLTSQERVTYLRGQSSGPVCPLRP